MKVYHCLGLMSGTSLDGLDIAYVRFFYPNFGFELIETKTIPYPDIWKQKLQNAIYLSGEQLTKLDTDYGYYLGELANEFIEKYKIRNLDFIASHGHTIFHNPKENYTLQIGNGMAINAKTSFKTVFDFRTQDVILNGQGAPLVPIGDELLFPEFDACLNLGGFSNISFKRNEIRIAFDICPVNIIMNKLAEKVGLEFDRNGDLAKSGNVNFELLNQLNNLNYYQQNPPKSLGIEWCLKEIFPLLEHFDLRPEDELATFCQHIADQISKVLNANSIQNVMVTGGGAYNSFLIELIQSQTQTEIILPEKNLIEFKEALIFGLMGLLKIENQVNVLCSVTGAKKNHSSGIVIGN